MTSHDLHLQLQQLLIVPTNLQTLHFFVTSIQLIKIHNSNVNNNTAQGLAVENLVRKWIDSAENWLHNFVLRTIYMISKVKIFWWT